MIQTRENNLQILRIVQLSILIGVKKLDEIVTVGLRNIGKSILTEEVQEVGWGDEAIFITIKTLKAAIWFEVEVGAQELSEDFEFLLDL